MTEKLYDYNSHLKEFDATVLFSDSYKDIYRIVLDKTAFFPEGGGQEADEGYIDNAVVSDVQIENGTIYHYTSVSFKKGQAIHGKINWEKRFRNMQNHSGEHIISGIVHKLYGYDNVGFHLGKDEMTVDFNGDLTRQDILKVERLVNEAVYKNVLFTCWYPTNEELALTEYRSKLDLTENVRLVKIEGYDICACCAPHVTSASEIGIIKILDFFRNKGGVRLFVKCGYDAIKDYNEKYFNILSISNILSVKQPETAEGVEKMLLKLKQEKYNNSVLRKALLNEKVKTFNNNLPLTLSFENEADIKDLQVFTDLLYKKYSGIRAAFSEIQNGYAFSISGDEDKLSLFFKEFKSNLNVKGGGRKNIVQGTVFSTESEIESFFKNYSNNL